LFSKTTGETIRYGKTLQDDPQMAPSPELLDLEISTNQCSSSCPYCYKENTRGPGANMSFDTFKKIIDKLTPFLTQIAFGLTNVTANPDFIRMMEYCREVSVIPNFTMTGVDATDEFLEKAVSLVGAIAVSVLQTNKFICYNIIEKLTNLGLEQTNMHLMYHAGNESFVYEVLHDIQNDPRLEKLNAVVLLALKQKGRGENLQPMPYDKFAKIVQYCFDHKIKLGFDSCSAPKFIKWVNESNQPNKEQLLQMAEPCESFGLFSAYINVKNAYFPCSFAESAPGWEEGIDVLGCNDFVKDIWMSDKVNEWRQKSLACNRGCLLYNV
jgi:hypothetical protein